MIKNPNYKPIYAHLTEDTKNGLTQLAKYKKVTLTSLLEAGARHIISTELKALNNNSNENQSLTTSLSW